MKKQLILCATLLLVLLYLSACGYVTSPEATTSGIVDSDSSTMPSTPDVAEPDNTEHPNETEETSPGTTNDSEENPPRDTQKILIVNGQSLAAASHMIFTSDSAMVPLVEVLEVLGAEIQWVNNYTANIIVKEKQYSLNTETGVLIKEENQANCFLPAPGSSVHYQVVDGVFLLDHITMRTVLMIMGSMVSVDVNYENNTVVITS